MALGDPPVMMWMNTPVRLGREVEGVAVEGIGGDFVVC